MKGHGTKFGRKMEEAIAALLSHRNVEEAAQSINLAPKTLLRWMQIEEFKAAYLKARQEAVVQATGRMQQATGAAGVTVLKLMTDPQVPPAARLRAAEFVFELAIKGIQMELFEVRLAEVEAAVERAKPNGARHLGLVS